MKLSINEIKDLGLNPLGNCQGIHTNLGLFGLNCQGCNEIKLKKSKNIKICGNCKNWKFSGKYE